MQRSPDVFVFNPFTEHSIARGTAFTPVKHQALLAEDLANLPQFLCQAGDIVLLAKRPSPIFLCTLRDAGFPLPEFVELKAGRIDPSADLCQQEIGKLRPWAWGPDSVELLELLFARVIGAAQSRKNYFNDKIAQLYSKAWMTTFLRTVLPRCRESLLASSPRTGAQCNGDQNTSNHWLCSEHELGRVVNTLADALEAIAAIRSRGHHRVVVKEAYGLAGRNMIRLWEPELLPAQRRWLTRAVNNSGALVVEPWLERASDFSLQLEMGPHGLQFCGYTGLVNDGRGQFLASWAEPNHNRQVPANVAALLHGPADSDWRLQRLYVELLAWLEPELQRAGFVGPISIDALIYRTSKGECRLKPVVEINPRCTMGRLTVELMKMVCPGSRGLFRLLTLSQVRAAGFADFPSYSASLSEPRPLRFEGEPFVKIRQGALCLNDPGQARVCLATFEVSPNQPLTSGFRLKRAALEITGGSTVYCGCRIWRCDPRPYLVFAWVNPALRPTAQFLSLPPSVFKAWPRPVSGPATPTNELTAAPRWDIYEPGDPSVRQLVKFSSCPRGRVGRLRSKRGGKSNGTSIVGRSRQRHMLFSYGWRLGRMFVKAGRTGDHRRRHG